jgi:hypothetical protein
MSKKKKILNRIKRRKLAAHILSKNQKKEKLPKEKNFMAEKLRTWFSTTTTELFRAVVNKVISRVQMKSWAGKEGVGNRFKA